MNILGGLFFLFLFSVGSAKKPNVLFIIADDLRPALGVYKDPNAFTPNIDKLAKRSFVFTNAFSQQALCAPSRNSLLTSRRPQSLHLFDFYSYWRESVGNFSTLPQYFKENGYFTHSIGKVFHLGKSSNFTDDYPYSWSEKTFHPRTEQYKEAKVCLGKDGKLGRNLLCPVVVESQPLATLPDIESKNAAISFLKSKKHPFFLAVGFHKPHIPFKFPIEYLNYHPLDKVKLPENRWRAWNLPLVAWNPFTDVRNRDDMKKINISFPFESYPDNITRSIIQHYNAAVTYMDALVGEVLEHVDNETIIVITSDHGWSRGEHGEFSKFSNFEVATKVPFIIHVPKLNNHKIVVDNLVELVDIFPTLVDLSQVSKSLEVCFRNGTNSHCCTEGKSMVSLMYNKVSGRKVKDKNAVFSQYPRPGPYPTLKPNSDKPKLNDIRIMGYTIRTKLARYTEWVRYYHQNFSTDWNTVYGRELYDHVNDPEENNNLIDREEMKEVVASLRKKLILGWRYSNF